MFACVWLALKVALGAIVLFVTQQQMHPTAFANRLRTSDPGHRIPIQVGPALPGLAPDFCQFSHIDRNKGASAEIPCYFQAGVVGLWPANGVGVGAERKTGLSVSYSKAYAASFFLLEFRGPNASKHMANFHQQNFFIT